MRAADPPPQYFRSPGTGRTVVLPPKSWRTGGPGTSDPQLIRFSAATLEEILTEAFDVSWNEISGPDWIGSQRYEIQAEVPDKSTGEQAEEMLRNLLIERLHLAYHRETKTRDGYELVRVVDESKLRVSSTDGADLQSGDVPPDSVRLDDKGFPILPRGVNHADTWMQGPRTTARFRQTSMPEFARWLSHQIGSGMLRIGNGIRATPSPVADKTGLTERYDFTFEYRGIPLGSILPVQLTAVGKHFDYRPR